MRAKLDPREGGLALNALLASDPDAALWVQIAKLRTIAIAKGEVPPEFFKIVPLETPSYFKAPGRKAPSMRTSNGNLGCR